jgi:hypothetical protein
VILRHSLGGDNPFSHITYREKEPLLILVNRPDVFSAMIVANTAIRTALARQPQD